MKVLVCGQSGKLVKKALDEINATLGIDEVIFGTSQSWGGVDIEASDWTSTRGVRWRVVPAERDGAHVSVVSPDLILVATATGNSHGAVQRVARSLLIPVCVVGSSGELRTTGRGWGSLLRAVLERQTRVMRKAAV